MNSATSSNTSSAGSQPGDKKNTSSSSSNGSSTKHSPKIIKSPKVSGSLHDSTVSGLKQRNPSDISAVLNTTKMDNKLIQARFGTEVANN